MNEVITKQADELFVMILLIIEELELGEIHIIHVERN